jgi:ribosome-binding ATPase YchF (GTP1/OBG family)
LAIKLKFDTFIKNANLTQIAEEIIKNNSKLTHIDKVENPKVIITINSIAKSLKRLDLFYSDDRSIASDDDKDLALKKLIVSHQSLLKLQSTFFKSQNEKDKEVFEILVEIASTLSAIYPLFLVSELVNADSVE